MNDLNLCQFIGRLGKDVEIRYMGDQTPIANFPIGCGWKTKTKEGTEWINVAAFGKLAEVCGQYLSKGSLVYVQGKLKTEKFEDKSGATRYITKVTAENVQFLSKKESPRQNKDEEIEDYKKPEKGNSIYDLENDLPF